MTSNSDGKFKCEKMHQIYCKNIILDAGFRLNVSQVWTWYFGVVLTLMSGCRQKNKLMCESLLTFNFQVNRVHVWDTTNLLPGLLRQLHVHVN